MAGDDRIAELETALAHHERQIEDLSDLISAQWKEIERLKNYIIRTEAKLDDYIDRAGEDAGLTPAEIAARDKPPHY